MKDADWCLFSWQFNMARTIQFIGVILAKACTLAALLWPCWTILEFVSRPRIAHVIVRLCHFIIFIRQQPPHCLSTVNAFNV